MPIMTACAAIGTGYFVISTATLTLTSGCSEIRPSVRKWSWDNLSLKQQASAPWSALKGRLASSSASTFLCNDSRDDIFAKGATPTSTGTTGSPMPVHVPSNVYSDQNLVPVSRDCIVESKPSQKDLQHCLDRRCWLLTSRDLHSHVQCDASMGRSVE